ncbi:MAG: S8 family serine peptidase [Nanoarchaeota archaeon]
MRIWTLLMICVLLSSMAMAAEIDSSIGRALENKDEVSVLILYHQRPQPEKMHPFEDRLKSLSRDEYKENKRYRSIPVISATVTDEGIKQLRDDPEVISVELNRPVQIDMDVSVPLIQANRLWNLNFNGTLINGSGQTVCVIDSGVNINHADLLGKVLGEACFCDNEGSDTDGIGCCPNGEISDDNSSDDNGHGTHVIGTIVSQNEVYRGVAPGANVVSVKAVNSSGGGWFTDVVDGIDWCITNKENFSISVITMSLGDGSQQNNPANCDGYATSNAIDSAVAAGILVTVSSGNDAYSNGISYPACASNATSVGAADDSDVMAGFTNTDEILDVVAPGVGIVSLSYTGGTSSKSGTSMAAPHVAAAGTLLQQAYKTFFGTNITPALLRTALKQSSISVSDSGLEFPRINLLDALSSLDNISPEITFNGLLLSNGSITNETSITFNVTSSETLDAVLLDVNGTNTSLDGENTAFNITLSDLRGWYQLTFYANDTGGNRNISPFLIYFNNTPPNITSFFPLTNVTIAEPNNQSFNVTGYDTDGHSLSYSWLYDGIEMGNESEFLFIGNYTTEGTHNITAIVSDGMEEARQYWNFTINHTNAPPSVEMATMLPHSPSTSDDLNCSYTYADVDGDSESDTFIHWYRNGILNASYDNESLVGHLNTSKHQMWWCEVIPSDGTLIGSAVNSSNVTILNSLPNMTMQDFTFYELDFINITLNATDADGDGLSYGLNATKGNFSSNVFIWNTTLGENGQYHHFFNVSDGEGESNGTFIIVLQEYLDYDNDAVPNHLDKDDDNDGINDTEDYLVGNVSVVNATEAYNLTINGTTNVSMIFNGSVIVNISKDNLSVVWFTFNFSNESRLDLFNLTVDRNGAGSILIRGIPDRGLKTNKTVRINDSSGSYTGVCIKDSDFPLLENITTGCTGTAETFVGCDGTITSGYSCVDEGEWYLVSGLNHSGVREQCVDADGDSYLNLGCGGTDCNDANPGINPGASDSCGNGIDEDCSGSDADCSSGGGGGGGGGSIAVTEVSDEEAALEEDADSGSGGSGSSYVEDAAEEIPAPVWDEPVQLHDQEDDPPEDNERYMSEMVVESPRPVMRPSYLFLLSLILLAGSFGYFALHRAEKPKRKGGHIHLMEVITGKPTAEHPLEEVIFHDTKARSLLKTAKLHHK